MCVCVCVCVFVSVSVLHELMACFLCTETHTPAPHVIPTADIPTGVRFLGERCMFEKPEERPSFSDLIQELQKHEDQC